MKPRLVPISVGRFYRLGSGKAFAPQESVAILGVKGAGLDQLCRAKVRIPPGVILTSRGCTELISHRGSLPRDFVRELEAQITWLQAQTRKKLGPQRGPMLVAVRLSPGSPSSALRGLPRSVLNLGINETTSQELAAAVGDPVFAHDCTRRLHSSLNEMLGDAPKPSRMIDQVAVSIGYLLSAWESARARAERTSAGTSDIPPPAIILQAMVYGNLGNTSAAGSAFSRDPLTGRAQLKGEFIVNCQGPDLPTGERTASDIAEIGKWNSKIANELAGVAGQIERVSKDAQEFEFVVERGTVFILRSASADRSAPASLKIAVDLVKQKIIDKKQAVLRINPESLDALLHPILDGKSAKKVIAHGVPASPGAAVGKLAFSAAEAQSRSQAGEAVILVCHETSPEDIAGMQSAVGILTSTGGMTSHAAVVARGWGKCCVAGADTLDIDQKSGRVEIDGISYGRDDYLSIDGSNGQVMEGQLPTIQPEMSEEFSTILQWADEFRTMGVRANADRPADARIANHFGAEGIGLCRTEHMFFDPERIAHIRHMILAGDLSARKNALTRLLPLQRADFVAIFTQMKGKPVTIRLLDPPLHEFLPKTDKSIRELATSMNVPLERLRLRVKQLHEVNPMLGHRGVRLSITFPEILQMQARAIFEAAAICGKKRIPVAPELMIPLVGAKGELDFCRRLVDETAAKVMVEQKRKIVYHFGTMIEVPRAALIADELAMLSEFFSFGTNDLTQLTYGYSRDDSGSFLPDYARRHILEADPFQTLDRSGVATLMQTAIILGKSRNPSLKCGICGEHAGDSRSIKLCHTMGLNYVSCSPYRVPIARIACAQTSIGDSKS